MTRANAARHVLGLGALLVLFEPGPAAAQPYRNPTPPPTQTTPATTPPPQASPAELAILQALQANPVTNPYSFAVSTRNGRVVLKGRVGSKVVHDVAIRAALSVTPRIDDGLTIDTAAAYVAAAVAGAPPAALPGDGGSAIANGMPAALPGYGAAGGMAAPYGYGAPAFPGAGAMPGPVPYVYPQPLFGYYDDPFYGFEPPVISYPPYWAALTARRLGPDRTIVPPGGLPPAGAMPGMVPPNAAGSPGGSPSQGGASSASKSTADGDKAIKRTVEMDIDPLGVAILRGSVPTLADAVAVGQRVAQLPGVSEVRNLITYEQGNADNAARPTRSDTPPPPPRPDSAPEVRPVNPARPEIEDEPDAAAPAEAIRNVGDVGGLAGRVQAALKARPALDHLPIGVRVEDGVATLSGEVPSVLEDMHAYRAAQQTPGVREVDDRLRFRVPNGEKTNPLVERGRPEDVEPYLEAQIRRQLGDQAHVDRVRLRGIDLEVRGIVDDDDDRRRVAAILRSMPVLRDFRVDPAFVAQE